ncbi:MAG TPA: hypothetical protein VI316_12825 [Candidatus Dormibacteraeota bacterium]
MKSQRTSHHHHHHDSSTAAAESPAWFAGRVPDGWFSAAPTVSVDTDEILVVGAIADVDLAAGATDAERATARAARVSRFREDTRDARMAIADEAQHRFGRRVSWGVDVGGDTQLFTNVAAPVMTRLRQPERQVLDTLIDAGVARSRSEALARCVRLVGRHQEEWLASLRDALGAVEKAREAGPEI